MTKQKRITELQARKAHADALGQEAIQQARALYDQIVDELFRLQLPEEEPALLLAAVMNEVGRLSWPQGDYLGDCEKFLPRYTRDVSDAEKLLNDAHSRGHPEAFRWYLPLYWRAWQALNAMANERLELERAFEKTGATRDYQATPFDKTT